MSSAPSVANAPPHVVSHWTFPLTFPGLGTRVDARQYGLEKHAEVKEEIADSRLELEKMIKEVGNHACPPCEPCEKCWLLQGLV